MLSLISRSAAVAAMAIALTSAPSYAKADRSASRAKASELTPAAEAPISCISPNMIRSTRVVDDQNIDFIMNNGTVYRNTLSGSCPGLKMEQRFSYKISTNQLCSVDIITVLQNFGFGFNQGASCGLGKFQKMEKAAPAPAS